MKRVGLLFLLAVLCLTLAVPLGCASTPAAPTAAPTPAGPPPVAATAAPAAPTAAAPAPAPTTGSAPAANAPAEIKIGASNPATGSLSGHGKYNIWGYKYAVNTVNADGGIFVKQYNKKIPVKLIQLDDESKPEKTSANVERLILNEGVVGVLGSNSPGLVIPGATVSEKNKTPFIGCACPLGAFRSAGKLTYAYDIFFDEGDMTTQQFKTMDMVTSNKKVALFTDNEEDGVIMGKLWEEAAPKMGYEVVYHANFPVGTTDYGDMIRKAQASGADIMIAQMIPPDTIALWRQMESLKWKPKAAFLEKGGEVVEFWDAVGKSGEGVCVAGFWHPDLGYPGSKELKDAYEKDTKEKYSQHISDGNTVAMLMMKAIEKAGSLDKEAINKAIPAAAAEGQFVSGPFKFADDNTGALPTVMLQWRDGDTYIVSPKEKAGKEFLYPLPAW